MLILEQQLISLLYLFFLHFIARGTRTPQSNRNRSKTSSNGISRSIEQSMDTHDSHFCPASSPYSTGTLSPFSTSECQTYTDYHEPPSSSLHNMSSGSNHSLMSNISEPNNGRSCSDISTQTNFSHLPKPLRKKAESAQAATSRIPRPVMQRSKTLDSIPTSSKLKRRNSTNSSGSSASKNNTTATMPRMLREKSGMSNRPNIRREKSDVTGQRSKYRTANSPGPVRRKGKKKLRLIYSFTTKFVFYSIIMYYKC